MPSWISNWLTPSNPTEETDIDSEENDCFEEDGEKDLNEQSSSGRTGFYAKYSANDKTESNTQPTFMQVLNEDHSLSASQRRMTSLDTNNTESFTQKRTVSLKEDDADIFNRKQTILSNEESGQGFSQTRTVSLDESRLSENSSQKNSSSVSRIYAPLQRRNHLNPISKPAFRVSAFITPSHQPSVAFETSLNSSSFDFTSGKRSPFYTGHTMFGGSSSTRESAPKRQKIDPVSNRVRTTRTQVSAKPLRTTKRNTVTSETAKRIMNTLGKMSAPIKDSHKFTSIATNQSFSQQLRKSGKQEKQSYIEPPVKRFIAQPLVSSSKMKPQDNSMMSQNIPNLSFLPQGLPASFSSASFAQNLKPVTKSPIVETNSKMKMKRERSNAHYSNSQKQEEIVNTMPEVSAVVPLVVNSLPSFKFSLSSSNAIKGFTPIPKATSVTFKDPKLTKTNFEGNKIKLGGFNFSSPGVVCDKTVLSTPNKNFAFSSPATVTSGANESPKQKTKPVLNIPMFTSKPASGLFKTDSKMNEGKIIKVLKNVAQPPPGSWECPTCMIQNNEDCLKCVACTESKPQKALSNQQPIKETVPLRIMKFSQPKDGWECPTCMIQNNEDCLKCVACTESKPQEALSNQQPIKKTVPLRIMKFSQPKDGWECPTCMIQNNEDCLKCVACTESKPQKALTNQQPIKETAPLRTLKFSQIKEGWECPTCMIQNEEDCLKCVACTEPKPASKADKTISKILTIPKPAVGSWECPTCMVKNDEDVTKCVACTESKPGNKNENDSTSVNLFGVSKDSETNKPSFKFGQSGASNFGTNSGFSFGKITDLKESTGQFTFGNPTESNVASGQFSFGKPIDSKGSKEEFSFEKPTNSNETTGQFLFGKPTDSKELTGQLLFGNSSDIKASFKFGSTGTKDAKATEVVDRPSYSTIADTASSGFLSVSNSSNTAPNLPPTTNSIQSTLTVPEKSSSSLIFGSSVSKADLGGFKADESTSKSSTADAPGGFKLTTSNIKPISVFGNSGIADSGFTFGAKTDKSKDKTAGFSFGTKPMSSGFPEVSSNSFPATSNVFNAFKVDSSNNVFGSKEAIQSTGALPSTLFSASSSEPAKIPFSFGKSNTSIPTVHSELKPPTDPTNSFMSVNPLGQNAAGSFNFTSAKPSFNFGSSHPPSFNNGSSLPNASVQALDTKPPPSFNFTNSTQPLFQPTDTKNNIFQNQNKSGFDFSNSAAIKTDFNFGSSQGNAFNTAQPTNNSNLFSLGNASSNNKTAGTNQPRRPIKRAARRLKK